MVFIIGSIRKQLLRKCSARTVDKNGYMSQSLMHLFDQIGNRIGIRKIAGYGKIICTGGQRCDQTVDGLSAAAVYKYDGITACSKPGRDRGSDSAGSAAKDF